MRHINLARLLAPGLLAALSALCLSGCLSPIANGETVHLEGRVLNEDGSPASDRSVQLRPPHSEARNTRSDAAGGFSFALAAEETRWLILAGFIHVTAAGDGGAEVSQRVLAFDKDLRLAPMRFWNQALAPAEGAVIRGDRAVFSWQQPALKPSRYRLELFDGTGLVWSSYTPQTSLEQPMAVLRAGQAHRWRVTALYPDFEASTGQRSLQSLDQSLHDLPVRAMRVGGEAMPGLHDGSYALSLSNRLPFADKASLELDLELDGPQRVSGLHWAGSGADVTVEVRSERTGTVLASQTIDDHALLSWAPVRTERLYLSLRQAGGLSDVDEIRVLGPVS